MIKLLLVDDHAVVRSGLHMILDQEEDVIIVGEAENASEAYNKTQELLPDVVLMDIGLPDMTGIEITKKIKENFPEVA
ncbi:MAG: response regulator transcription factor, partial [Chloroflexi bacterium]|nr:response regulator transcription factor [Chloroflexota bacterium]